MEKCRQCNSDFFFNCLRCFILRFIRQLRNHQLSSMVTNWQSPRKSLGLRLLTVRMCWQLRNFNILSVFRSVNSSWALRGRDVGRTRNGSWTQLKCCKFLSKYFINFWCTSFGISHLLWFGNDCWLSPVQSFLVSGPEGPMTIIFCLKSLTEFNLFPETCYHKFYNIWTFQ